MGVGKIRSIFLSVSFLVVWGAPASAEPPTPKADAVIVEKENLVEAQIRGQVWRAGELGLGLAVGDKLRTGEYSRAAVRFPDLSMLRVDELTTVEIAQPSTPTQKQILGIRRGGIYLHHRDKPLEMQIRTPAANGAIRGTEFAVRVAGSGRTTVAVFDGEVELSNAHGRVSLQNGELGEVDVGRAPRKTAMIEAVNYIQWCLYYPAVLDPLELGADSKVAAAYRAGDLPGALRALPRRGLGSSARERLLRASVILSSGQVEDARAVLAGIPAREPGRVAIEKMIAAVQFREWRGESEPSTASEWLAESYYRQSRDRLVDARQAARRATELSSQFGFAWVRLAELEFSFGRTGQAMQALERGLELSPRNAQGVALQGFLLSAENRTGAARRSFEAAIALDGALGNAWLGRGLALIRQGQDEEGRRDIQTAAVLEPNRSLLRSYLGKAFSEVGMKEKADAELDRAKALDPADPTPWLYSAIQLQQENRYNEAIADLERSVVLNDNRGIYRSQFLLDQDRAVRDANLAVIYRRNGMVEQSVREAVRGVASDYTSASAHLFLSNSYDELRDPQRIRLRYDPVWSSELLLSQLLSPVGGGSLSQFVSQHEYSKLFESDGPHFASLTDYFSHGQVRASASQFGTVGNLSYALDGEYFYSDGVRPNNRLSRYDLYGSFKLQLGPQDTVLFRAEMGDLRTGDVYQRYDQREVSFQKVTVENDGVSTTFKIPNRAAQTFNAHEEQDPGALLFGWHHQWSPTQHTLLLLGRLGNELSARGDDASVPVMYRDVTEFFPFEFPFEVGYSIPRDKAFFDYVKKAQGRGPLAVSVPSNFDFDYRADLVTYSAELQHIALAGPMTLLAGARFQSGEFEIRDRLTDPNNGQPAGDYQLYLAPPAQHDLTADYERLNIYLYDIWRVAPWLSLTAGVTYDRIEYPQNFLSVPLSDRQTTVEKVLPKFGLIAQPWSGATLRAAYTESLGGASFDEGVRLEPSQIAGFPQVQRNLASESLVGSLTGSEFHLTNLSFEQKLPWRTYLGFEASFSEQEVDRTVGAFEGLVDIGVVLAILPSAWEERNHYREQSFSVTLDQLVGDRWAFGARYRYTHSELEQTLQGFDRAIRSSQDSLQADYLVASSPRRLEADLQQLSLHALYNHPCGFFARAEANWYRQDNDDFVTKASLIGPEAGFYKTSLKTTDQGRESEDFWQFNVFAGYRFYRNQCEISCGVLNLTGEDYHLNPLNPYQELVRDRTFMVRCRLNF